VPFLWGLEEQKVVCMEDKRDFSSEAIYETSFSFSKEHMLDKSFIGAVFFL
jgi:hypothetical protein